MKIFKQIKKEITSLGFLIWLIITLIIIVISFIFVNYSTNLTFSKDTYYWFTSTIAQTFGALLGILIAVAIFRHGQIEAYIEKMVPKTASPEQVEKPKLWPHLYLPAQSILVLIAWSLLSLSLIDYLGPKGLALMIIALLFYSLYCLALLIYRISKYFS